MIQKSVGQEILDIDYKLRFDIIDMINDREMTIADLSKECDIKYSQMKKILLAEVNVSLKTIAKICYYLKMNPSINFK